MDSQTGNLYSSKEEAKKAGVREKDIILLSGTPEAIKSVSDTVKKNHNRKKNKAAKAARKKNR